MWPGMNDRSIQPRLRFKSASTFVVYYGANRLDELAMFDVAILEPSAYSSGDVAGLSSRGCLPIGYVSVLESGEHLPHHARVSAHDFLTVSGSRVAVPEYGTWVMDVRRPHWREILLSVAGEILDRQGFSGLFLDTVGQVEHHSFPQSLSLEMSTGVLDLLAALREAHPGAVLIQNLGLERLIRHTAPLLDGVCWEAFGRFPKENLSDYRWTVRKMKELLRFSRQHGLRVMLLGRSDMDGSLENLFALARWSGFMCYGTESYSRAIETRFAEN